VQVFLWLGLGAALLLLLLVVAARVPLTLSGNLQAKAEPSGVWVIACGLGLGPIALSAIAAAGVKPFLTCHVFGKQLARLPISRWVQRRRPRAATGAAEVDSESESETEAPLTRFERGVAGLFRSLDPLETLLSWWEKDRIFRVRSLLIELEYSFRDVALTGKILAALYMLSAVLPEVCEIRQTPGWESEDRVSLAMDAEFKIWPGRLLLSLTGFVLKQRSEARRSARLSKQATHVT
jgi:hypothetical protein